MLVWSVQVILEHDGHGGSFRRESRTDVVDLKSSRHGRRKESSSDFLDLHDNKPSIVTDDNPMTVLPEDEDVDPSHSLPYPASGRVVPSSSATDTLGVFNNSSKIS